MICQNERKALDVIFEIAGTSSRNEKEAILTREKDNETLQQILEYTYNPYKVYGIGSKAFAKKYQATGEVEFNTIISLLQYLLENNTGSDEAKLKVNAFLLQQSDTYRDLCKKIILKDLKAGFTANTINKIWNGLIPVFKVMLAEPFERLPNRVAVEYKFDGVRATAVKQNGQTQLFTRNGKTISGFDSILEQLNSLPCDNVVFDGELISDNDYKATMEKVFKKTGNKQADYMMFDMLTLKEFNTGKSEATYEERREHLSDIFVSMGMVSAATGDLFESLRIAPVITVIENPDAAEINTLTLQAVELGFEGTMVKDLDGLYHCKRTYDWQKSKPFEDGDFEIIRIEEGQGKNVGRMGKVVIDVNGVEVGLGTGWNDEERIDMWNNPNKYIGQIVEVQYQNIIQKSGSLRFPSVKGIRWDK